MSVPGSQFSSTLGTQEKPQWLDKDLGVVPIKSLREGGDWTVASLRNIRHGG